MLGDHAAYEVRAGEDGLYVLAIGEIDMASAPAFAAAIDRLTVAQGSADVDMSGVTFMDSTGLNVLCAAATNTTVRLRNVPDGVRRILALTGLDDTLIAHR
jgi:anti-anti-sigma factor